LEPVDLLALEMAARVELLLLARIALRLVVLVELLRQILAPMVELDQVVI
jgi:hypothetical protein